MRDFKSLRASAFSRRTTRSLIGKALSVDAHAPTNDSSALPENPVSICLASDPMAKMTSPTRIKSPASASCQRIARTWHAINVSMSSTLPPTASTYIITCCASIRPRIDGTSSKCACDEIAQKEAGVPTDIRSPVSRLAGNCPPTDGHHHMTPSLRGIFCFPTHSDMCTK